MTAGERRLVEAMIGHLQQVSDIEETLEIAHKRRNVLIGADIINKARLSDIHNEGEQGTPVSNFEPDDRHIFPSGASSSGRKPRFDLIPTYALTRMARRFEEGATKYGVNNWQKGLSDSGFIIDRLNHAIEHLLRIRDRMQSPEVCYWELDDDDAAAVMLNTIFIMGYQEAQKTQRETRRSAQSIDGDVKKS